MRNLIFTIKFIFIVFLLSFSQEFIAGNNNKINNEIIIESDKQISEPSNSTFLAEGNVFVTNEKKEFFAKSNKAIFYKLDGKIKLIGNVEVKFNNDKVLKAGEVIYYLSEKKFEAVSNPSQRVNTTLTIDELEISK